MVLVEYRDVWYLLFHEWVNFRSREVYEARMYVKVMVHHETDNIGCSHVFAHDYGYDLAAKLFR